MGQKTINTISAIAGVAIAAGVYVLLRHEDDSLFRAWVPIIAGLASVYVVHDELKKYLRE